MWSRNGSSRSWQWRLFLAIAISHRNAPHSKSSFAVWSVEGDFPTSPSGITSPCARYQWRLYDSWLACTSACMNASGIQLNITCYLTSTISSRILDTVRERMKILKAITTESLGWGLHDLTLYPDVQFQGQLSARAQRWRYSGFDPDRQRIFGPIPLQR